MTDYNQNSVLEKRYGKMDDGSLLERIFAHDSSAFQYLLQVRYAALLASVAGRFNTDGIYAEDLVMDILVHLCRNDFRALRLFRGDTKFSTWLTRVAVNCCISSYPRLKGQASASIDEAMGIAEDRQLDCASVLEEFMALIGEEERIVLTLGLEGYDVSEIAAFLSGHRQKSGRLSGPVTTDNVYKIRSRAIARLRKAS